MTQAEALKIMQTGVNVYLSGSAGSGKTYLLNQYIAWLRDHNIPVAVTASTGIAATHMGGMTIHGFSGIGIRDFLSDYDLDALTQKPYLSKRFEETQVLIIDEVSMLHARTLDMVERVARAFRRNDKPFGGMQVILSGDFFQLPPITKSGFGDNDNQDADEAPKDFIFYSNAWLAAKFAVCYLTEQHRQEDEIFTRILNKIREGYVDDEHLAHIGDRLGADLPEGVRPTKLYTHNVDVDAINYGELGTIDGPEKVFGMYSKGRTNLVEILKKSCLAPETLRLKIGAEVMFIKNDMERRFVNGTRGIVEGFGPSTLPIVRLPNGQKIEVETDSWRIEENGKIKAEIVQIPLRLAWAITIHKSQGMSLDYAEIDLSKTFTYGMGYVALSRVRTLAGLRLVGFNPESLLVDPRILELDEKLQIESDENIEMFGNLQESEHKKLVDDFIIRTGGTLEKVIIPKKIKIPTTEVTRRLLSEGKTLEEIAEERGMVVGTIVNHLDQIVADDPDFNCEHVRPSEKHIELVEKHMQKPPKGSEGKIGYIKTRLDKAGENLTFEDIRLARIFAKKL